MDAGELVVSLGLDPSEFQKGLQNVQSGLQEGGQKIASLLTGPIAAALAGLAGSFAMGAMVDTFAQQADAAGKLADSLNVDVEAMQAWGEAAARAGGSSGAFQNTLRSLNSQVAMLAATGKGRLQPIFQQLGISVKDAGGKARSTFDILTDLAGKAETMGKAEFAGLAQRLGIDQGTVMLLQSGKRGVEDLVARQKELGVYTKEDTRIAAAYNDAMADFKQVLNAVAAMFMRPLIPALTAFREALVKVLSYLREHQPFVLSFFAILAALLTAKAIPAMRQFAAATLRAMAPFLPIIAVVAGLALVIDDLITYINGGESALSDLWAVFGTGPEIAAALTAAWEWMKATGVELWESIKAAAVTFFSYFSGAWEPIKTAFQSAITFIKALFIGDFEAAGAALRNTFDAIKEYILALFTGIANFLSDIWAKIKGMFTFEGLDGLSSVIGKVSGAGKSFFSGFFGGGENKATSQSSSIPAASAIPTTGEMTAAGISPDITNNNTSNTSVQTTINGVTINTQATNAEGIASAMPGAMQSAFNRQGVMAAETGVRQ